ncbi:MAG TPA: hypothetical protein VLI45_06560 [Acidobacteriaceae bacterium]|nr:hypothetical protein [Acidobacteriaceae bacterium]
MKSERSHAFYILTIAIIARLITAVIHFHAHPVPPLTDWGYENIAIALSISGGHGYGSPFFVASGPTAIVPPGYPLLLALAIALFGTGTTAATIIIGIQFVLSLATIPVVMFIARSHFDIRTANLAGFICAICVPIFYRLLFIWDTTLSGFLLIAAVAIAPILNWSRKQSVAIGIATALATLTNPALLPPLVAIFAWSAWRMRIKPFLAVIAFVIALSPWPLRNVIALHSFIPFRSNFGYEFWAGNHEGTNGQFSQYDTPIYSSAERQEYLGKGELTYMREKQQLAKIFIENHPREFARFCLKRVVQFWIGTSSNSPAPATPTLSILGLIGLALLWRRKQIFVLFALPLAMFPLVYCLTHVQPRFLAIISPILAVLGAYACESFLRILNHWPKPMQQ